MNSQKILGQALLWVGFLSAALAACGQKEFDFLADEEKTALDSLEKTASISQLELEGFTDKKLDELTAAELTDLCSKIAPILKQRAEEAKAAAAKEKESGEKAEKKPKDEAKVELTPEEKKKNRAVNRESIIKARTSLIENKWSTVSWLWYGISAGIGIFGVLILRKASKGDENETHQVEANYSVVNDSLAELELKIGDLKKQLPNMAPMQVVNFIDEQCADPFANFADARNALVHRFGLDAYANIMTQFASGERFVNRAWSAAADGYMNEVKDCVDRAQAHLARAAELVIASEKGTSVS